MILKVIFSFSFSQEIWPPSKYYVYLEGCCKFFLSFLAYNVRCKLFFFTPRVEGEEMAEDKDYVWDHYEESVKVKSYTC